MAYVVTEACVKCKYTDCVAVCPVDCFREGENMLVIEPNECIDCQACVPACPVNAIYFDEDVPAQWAAYTGLNKELSAIWPQINKAKKALDTAEAFKAVTPKWDHISRKAGR